MSDITFNKFEIEVPKYLPIIVLEVYPGYPQYICITDSGLSLASGDILVTSANSKAGSWKIFITEHEYVEDLFDSYVIIQVTPVTNYYSLWHVEDFVDIGDELKLLGNAHEEK